MNEQASNQVGFSVEEVTGIPVNTQVAFTNRKGTRKPGFEKRQRKLIGELSPYLKPFLAEGETVQIITTACSPMSGFEQFTMGWAIVYLKRALLVFTDRRILHLPSTMGYKYRQSVAQVMLGDVMDARIRGRSLVLRYKAGKTEKFYYVSNKERSRLKAWLKSASFDAAPTGALRTHLCPRCTVALPENVAYCGHCRLEFKTKGEATKISWLVPGGGYFYSGHPILGAMDAIVEGVLLLVLLMSLVMWMGGDPVAGSDALVFAVILGLEKLLTVYHAGHFLKEFIPKEKGVRARTA